MSTLNAERVHSTDPDGLFLIKALRAHLPVLMQKHQTPGLNIAVADKGRLIWEAGFGLADVAAGRPMLPDSVYHSGSLGKAYTATAVMMLVDQGVISLDDPINKHLPFEVRNPLGARAITICDLMVHTSGLSVDGAASSWTPGRSLADDLAAEYASEWSPMYGGRVLKRWINPVGSTWTYSNLGIATLGLIVESANPAGVSFSEFVQNQIMNPLGMTHSCYPAVQHPDFVPQAIWSRATAGYSRMGQTDLPTLPVYFREYPAGGVLARPADHIRLLLAMLRGGELDGYRLFSEEIARQMVSPATTFGVLRNAFGNLVGEQGLVWKVNDVGLPWTSFEHAGGHMFGWRTQGKAWPHYNAAVMVAANQWSLPDETTETQEVAEFVGTWLRHRQPMQAPPLSASAMSYARGALLAAAYRITFGIPGELPDGAVEELIAHTRNRGSDWDTAGFRRGFAAVSGLPRTLEAIHAFWQSTASEIDPPTLHAAYASMGGRPATDFLWNLLPPSEAPHEGH